MEKLMKFNPKLYERLANSAAVAIEYFDGDARNAMLKQLRNEVENLCKMEEQVKIADKIKERIRSAYETEATTEEDKNQLIEDYKNQISEIKPDLSANEHLCEFDRIVAALENDDGGDNASGDDDADLQLTRNPVNVIDPITKKRMTVPVKNSICGHIYDSESVAALIAGNSQTLCPVPGCKFKDPLKMKNMRTDLVTKIYLLKHPA